ncbi:MAG: hypothetical protein RMY34_29425 [Aulosira sp. DedQUE10]|nr:hypothetical protein [Aulosira sp. DedQUE10]
MDGILITNSDIRRSPLAYLRFDQKIKLHTPQNELPSERKGSQSLILKAWYAQKSALKYKSQKTSDNRPQ